MAPTPINFAEQAWINAAHYNNAMDNYQAFLAKNRSGDAKPVAQAAPVKAKSAAPVSSNNLVNKIQETRNNIKEAIAKEPENNLVARIDSVEAENAALKAELKNLTARFAELESRLNKMGSTPAPKAAAAPVEEDDDDDDIDLFGSDDEEEDAAAEKLKAERVAAYNERKAAKEAKKGVLIA